MTNLCAGSAACPVRHRSAVVVLVGAWVDSPIVALCVEAFEISRYGNSGHRSHAGGVYTPGQDSAHQRKRVDRAAQLRTLRRVRVVFLNTEGFLPGTPRFLGRSSAIVDRPQ